jgi:hypothetical protein
MYDLTHTFSANRTKIAAALAFCSLSALAIAQPANAGNLVKNGSFETADLGDKSWATFDSIEGWTATNGSKIEIQQNAAGKAQDGNRLAELDSHSYNVGEDKDLGFFQEIQTEIGKSYLLNFFYSARPNIATNHNSGTLQNAFTVSFGDNFSQQFDAGSGGAQTQWIDSGTLLVKAVSELTRLQFTYLGKRDTYGAYIDNVTLAAAPEVEAVPEPASALGLLAVSALGLARKRR